MIESAFGGGAYRANDRLRNAGPVNGWSSQLGPVARVLLFDADKNHHWHPTQSYDVQVGWYERIWKTCFNGFLPHPCRETVWRTAQRSLSPSVRTAALRTGSVGDLQPLILTLACALGVPAESRRLAGGALDPCEIDPNSASLATLKFYLPYQDTAVPAPSSFTTYWWRFRTNNGTTTSGWTGWSSSYRSF